MPALRRRVPGRCPARRRASDLRLPASPHPWTSPARRLAARVRTPIRAPAITPCPQPRERRAIVRGPGRLLSAGPRDPGPPGRFVSPRSPKPPHRRSARATGAPARWPYARATGPERARSSSTRPGEPHLRAPDPGERVRGFRRQRGRPDPHAELLEAPPRHRRGDRGRKGQALVRTSRERGPGSSLPEVGQYGVVTPGLVRVQRVVTCGLEPLGGGGLSLFCRTHEVLGGDRAGHPVAHRGCELRLDADVREGMTVGPGGGLGRG